MPSLADMEGLLFHGITTFVTPLPTSASEPTFQCNWKWDMGLLSPNHSNSRPADILVQGWERGLPAAFDITVSSPLTPASLEEASASAGATARIAETRKHSANDSKCQELGWVGTPLAVESYGNSHTHTHTHTHIHTHTHTHIQHT